ncbi:Heparinase II/III-like protein [compost metagenome]
MKRVEKITKLLPGEGESLENAVASENEESLENAVSPEYVKFPEYAESPKYTEAPELTEIVSRMSPTGLHIYFPDGDARRFWRNVRNGKEYAADLAEIRAEGDRLRGAAWPDLTYSLFSQFAQTGSRLAYERAYFERRRRLNTYALLSLLEPECEEHHTELLEAIWRVCSEVSWCLPAHVSPERPLAETIDLFAAETGYTLAELSVLLSDRLPEMLHVHIAELVYGRLLKPFVESGPYEWEEAEHNWSAVCAGSIGSAALLLLDENQDRELLARILEKTQHSMTCYLKGFGDDGACLEGLGYWNYGFGYFVYYADLLYKRSRGELDWFAQTKVKTIAGFQQKCFLGGSAVVNFSDALPYGSVHIGLSRYISSTYASVPPPPSRLRADYREDHCSRWAPALRNLLWRGLSAEVQDWEPGDFLLKDAGWLISRTVSPKGVFGFAAKGGHNDEPHNHNDLGQFMLAGDGEFFLSDLGCGEYTKDYFGLARYTYDCNGSQGHSVPMINGGQQMAGRARTASILEQTSSGMETRMAVELSKAYDCEALLSFKRSWLWSKEELPDLELRDVFAFSSKPLTLVERFVTLIQPEELGEGRLLLSRSDLALELVYDQRQLQAEVKERIYRDHFGKDQVWYTLDFHVLQPERHLELSFLFQFIRQ